MKIGLAQTKPVTGDIQSNIVQHIKHIDQAVSNRVDLLVFPELSLTGYEPELAKELATHQDDPRFDILQQACDTGQISIGVGVPTKNDAGICISMILFQPHQARRTYSKKYLHADEEPFFIPGQTSSNLQIKNTNIALAICYEISVPEHSEKAVKSGAKIYMASVAKFVNGIDKAKKRLADIAQKYSMTVLMSNCIGLADGQECAGQSAVWNDHGILVEQLNGTQEGLLLIDTGTLEVNKSFFFTTRIGN